MALCYQPSPWPPPAQAPQSSPGCGRDLRELIGRAFLRVGNAAVIKPEPGARRSTELAAAFEGRAGGAAAAGPKNVGCDVRLEDIDGWKKSDA
jgi:hypothetical protein